MQRRSYLTTGPGGVAATDGRLMSALGRADGTLVVSA